MTSLNLSYFLGNILLEYSTLIDKELEIVNN